MAEIGQGGVGQGGAPGTVRSGEGQAGQVRGPLAQVPVEITVSVGRARPAVRELMALRPDAVLPLDRRIDDPVDLYVGDRLIARGELVEGEGEHAGMLAVRLTEIADLNGGL